MVQHFAEQSLGILVPAPFAFSGLPLASQLHRSLALAARPDGPVKPSRNGEPMSQESNWNPTDCYGESLHSSEVMNVRELKFCEGCGVLLVRLQGSKTRFCSDCTPPLATAQRRIQ